MFYMSNSIKILIRQNYLKVKIKSLDPLDMENKPRREKGWKESGGGSRGWGVGTATERRPRGTAKPGVEGLGPAEAEGWERRRQRR